MDVSYDLEETMLMKLVEERHPDVEDPIELFYIDDEGEELRAQYAEEIRASSDFDDAIAKQFINCNIEHFRHFNVNEAQLEQLGTLLTKEYLQQLEFQQHLVEQFKELLNLQEMSWIRPDRIHNL
ncbi:hypothetical protein [Paenibacillus sp. LHD-38]|uniref:hypothetical protein n=1 Tax=Paenibacillus sp. LHD-38 TaxID=3072143 RepID=UPI00280C926A|nr:hypothetical protein [Paenibacillus sp. LHD-38]MDQ8738068.1 hypothetical protein [Paenibacillus sp. LHD-38]